MKRYLVIIAGIVLFCCGLFMWRSLKPIDKESIVISKESENETLADSIPSRDSKREIPKGLKEWMSEINFWGVVRDLDGRPVPDATVVFEWTNLSKEGSEKHIATTDTHGFVKLTNQTGKRLVIRASKTGYESIKESMVSIEFSDPTNPLFVLTDERSPIQLLLRKRGDPDRLILRHNLRLVLDGDLKAIGFDLLSQRRVLPSSEDADLVFEVNPGEVRPREGPFNWRVVVRAPKGGVQLGTAGAWKVPEAGFDRELVFIGLKDSIDWKDHVDEWIFVRSRDDQINGLFHLYVAPSPRSGRVTAAIEEVVVNPFGGRGLEYSTENDVTDRFMVPEE